MQTVTQDLQKLATFDGTPKLAQKVKQKSKPQRQPSSKLSSPTRKRAPSQSSGSKTNRAGGESISTTHGAGTEVKDGWVTGRWTGSIFHPKPFSNSTGCFYHGCPKCYQDREQFLAGGKKAKDLFEATKKRAATIRQEGFAVVENWGCEYVHNPPKHKPFRKTFRHAILFDFEAIGDKNQRKEPTNTLTLENVYVPISVSIGDTLEPIPTFICDKVPKELCRKFMEELERRCKNIRDKVRQEFIPADFCLLPKVRQLKIKDWCDQVPVLGFNSGRYDLNLKKEHFVEQLTETQGNVKVAKNANKIMFMVINKFRFWDIINYLGPAQATASGSKRTDAQPQNPGSRTSGLTPRSSSTSQVSRLTRVVFQTQKSIQALLGRVEAVQAVVQRTRDANLR